MAQDHKPKTDDDLLADAIPIDPADLEELEEVADVRDAISHGAEDLAPIELDATLEDEGAEGTQSGRTIQTFGPAVKHEDKWHRTPNTPGTGAIHVKTFVTKLRLDAVEHMDQQINEWLDAHPQYEVKFVTESVGKLIGKNVEEALFVSVWV